jgi:hypothetical protein
MERNGLPFESEGIFVTNVISHAFMFATVKQLIQRRWHFEACFAAFAMFSSFLYHLTQALQVKIFMEELQWHFLDNIGAIGSFAIFFNYACCHRDPHQDNYFKIILVLFSVVIQVPHPWDIQFTFAPIALFALLPLISLIYRTMYQTSLNLSLCQRVHQALTMVYNPREAAIGIGLLVCAFYFFGLGLDEKHDPYRMYHGLWHTFGGLSALHLWRIVKDPIQNDTAAAIDRIRINIPVAENSESSTAASSDAPPMVTIGSEPSSPISASHSNNLGRPPGHRGGRTSREFGSNVTSVLASVFTDTTQNNMNVTESKREN